MKYLLLFIFILNIYADTSKNYTRIEDENQTNNIKIKSALLTSIEAGKEIQEKYLNHIEENKIESVQNLYNELYNLNKNIYFSDITETNINEEIIKKDKIINNFIVSIKKRENINFENYISEEEKIIINNKNILETENDLKNFRNNIIYENLYIKKEIFEFLINIKKFLNQYQKEEKINNFLKENEDLIKDKELLLEQYYNILKSKKYESKISKIDKENINKLVLSLHILKDLKSFIEDNKENIFSENIIFTIKLDTIISEINSFNISNELNKFIIQTGLDTGRIILFLTSFLFFYFFQKNLNYLFNYFENKNYFENTNNDILIFIKKHIKLLFKIKNEIIYLFLILGFTISINLLFYPEVNKTIENINFILNIFVYTLITLKIFNYLIEIKIENINNEKIQKSKLEIINLSIKFGNVSIIIYYLLITLKHFDINLLMGFISIISFIGLALSLGSKDLISNFFGGIKLLIDGSIIQGDVIEYEDIKGHVVQRGLMTTTVRTFYNEMVIVPNSNLVTKNVKNKSRKKIGSLIKFYLNLDFSNDIEKIEILREEIENYIKNNPDISINIIENDKKNKLLSAYDLYGVKKNMFVRITDITEFSIKLKISCYSKTVDYDKWVIVRDRLIIEVLKLIRKNNIEMAKNVPTIINN